MHVRLGRRGLEPDRLVRLVPDDPALDEPVAVRGLGGELREDVVAVERRDVRSGVAVRPRRACPRASRPASRPRASSARSSRSERRQRSSPGVALDAIPAERHADDVEARGGRAPRRGRASRPGPNSSQASSWMPNCTLAACAGAAPREDRDGKSNASTMPSWTHVYPIAPPANPCGGVSLQASNDPADVRVHPRTSRSTRSSTNTGIRHVDAASRSRSAVAREEERDDGDAVSAEGAALRASGSTGRRRARVRRSTTEPARAPISTGRKLRDSGSMSHESSATAGMRKTATCAAEASAISAARAIFPRIAPRRRRRRARRRSRRSRR